MQTTPTSPQSLMNWLQRFGFRFIAVYLLLFHFPFPLGIRVAPDPSWAFRMWGKMWQAITPWVGLHVLGMSDAYSDPSFVEWGSDSWYQWIQTGCLFVLALVAASVWVWFDRQRKNDARIHELLRVYLRFVLAADMLVYGMSKVILLQFSPPIVEEMLMRHGDLSPFRLLWTCIGYSPTYQIFCGGAEVIAGGLLFSRRTTTLGALLATGVMTNVVMMNLCYGVPVKLHSSHLLLTALFLLSGDMRRLLHVFVLNRKAEPAARTQLWPEGRVARWANAIGVLVIAFVLYSTANCIRTAMKLNGRIGPRPPVNELAGYYEVETFKRNGEVAPPLLTDQALWRRIRISDSGGLTVWNLDYKEFFKSQSRLNKYEPLDATQGRLTITPATKPDAPPENPTVLTYARPDPDHLLLEGHFQGAAISVTLRRVALEDFRLMQAKFRWVGR